jgi:hypothetical protein
MASCRNVHTLAHTPVTAVRNDAGQSALELAERRAPRLVAVIHEQQRAVAAEAARQAAIAAQQEGE